MRQEHFERLRRRGGLLWVLLGRVRHQRSCQRGTQLVHGSGCLPPRLTIGHSWHDELDAPGLLATTQGGTGTCPVTQIREGPPMFQARGTSRRYRLLLPAQATGGGQGQWEAELMYCR
eukprot:3753579-Amphidinium_carterae.1